MVFFETEPLQLNNVDSIKKAAFHFLEKTKQHLGGKNIHTMIGEGDYTDSILRSAKEIRADVIIMGSHSRKWLENILIESVTEKVLHNTTVPLFIIPTKQKK